MGSMVGQNSDTNRGPEGSPLLNSFTPPNHAGQNPGSLNIRQGAQSEPSNTTPLIHASAKPERDLGPHELNELKHLAASQSWIPRALQRTTLIAFIAISVAIIITLAVLFDYSNKHNGLATVDQDLHYLWTYGPTAVFIIVGACWTKVDYHARQLAPWRSLASGSATAEKSLLRDYVSIWNAAALYFSVFSRDFHVTFAVLGTLLFQLMTIFSTGLFSLEQRPVTLHGAQITTNYNFANVSDGEIDGRAFMSAMATRQYGLPYRNGTTETFAYQTVNISHPDAPSNTTVTATVDAFRPDLECKVMNATWTLVPDFESYWGSGLYQWEFHINDPECPHSGAIDSVPLESLEGYYPWETNFMYGINRTVSPCNRWWIMVVHVELDSFNHTGSRPSYNFTWEDSYGINSTEEVEGFNFTSYRDGKKSISCIACDPKLEMRKARIRTNGSTYDAALIDDSPSSEIADMSAWDLFRYSMESRDEAEAVFRGTNSQFFPRENNVSVTGAVVTMMNLTMPRLSPHSWMDTDFLINSARKSYQSIAVQVARDYLIQQVPTNSTATLEWTESRLILRALSYYLLTVLLVILIICSVVLALSPPVGVVPRDPGSIAGISAIVASSPELNKSLRNAGHSSAMTKISATGMAPFHSGVRGCSFTIRTSGGNGVQEQLNPASVRQQRWFRPLYGTILGRSAALLGPVVAIIVLEVLYHRSQQNDGVANVTDEGYDQYAWKYIPALFILFINLSFGNIYSLSTTLYPYYTLKQQDTNAEDALTYNLMGNILIRNAWQAIRRRRYAMLFTSITVALGTILPIAVAGLYTPEHVTKSEPILLQPKTQLNASYGFYDEGNFTAYNDSTNIPTHNGNPMPSMLLYSNLTFPRGTFDTFALEEYDFSNDDIFASDGSMHSSIVAQVPAVRGRINCTAVPKEKISFHYPPANASAEDYFNINSWVEIDAGNNCSDTIPGVDNWTQLSGFNTSSTNDYLFGMLLGDSLLSRFSTFAVDLREENRSHTDAAYHGMYVLPNNCPRGMMVFGKGNRYYDGNKVENDTIKEATVMKCWPYVERVILNTTFSLPSMDIIRANPLPPDPKIPGGYPVFSEAEILQTPGTPVMYTADWQWVNYLSSFRKPNDPIAYAFDFFMDAVIWGAGGIPATELLGEDNLDRLHSRVDKVYGTIMAQLYNSAARIPAESNAQNLRARAANERQYRMVQNMISTRILVAVLAAMFISCALSFYFLDTKDIVPQNPCSIAASASFVAGSRLVDRSTIPEGSEFLSDGEMIRRNVLGGMKFRLGWWHEGADQRFGIDVVGDDKKVT